MSRRSERQSTERPIAEPAQQADTEWHALPVDAVERLLDTRPEGLAGGEVVERLRTYGPNRLEAEAPPSVLRLILRQFLSPLIYILVLAALVTFVLGEYIDTGVIVAVLLLNAVIGFTQEQRAEHSVRALMGMVAPRARVRRNGLDGEFDSSEVVPGDVVLLESGARVPADIRLTSAVSLHIDESLLTGESLPIRKRVIELNPSTILADRVNLAHGGSIVTSGRGTGYVIATGAASVIGSIAEQVRDDTRPETPLQQRMDHFGKIIGLVIVLASIAAFAIGMVRGEDLSNLFIVVVAMAVAAIPEGLPVAFTITLAVGVRRMARRNAIVRRLAAVETLGSTTVIGSDKTGTLTENQMTVSNVWTTNGLMAIDRSGIESDMATDDTLPTDPLLLALLAGTLANEGDIRPVTNGYERVGDPTETAILEAAAQCGIDIHAVRERWRRFAEIPFESERQYSASIREVGDGQVEFVKGSPERVLAMCGSMQTGDGTVALAPQLVLDASHELASDGQRVLATAYRPLDVAYDDPHDIEEPEGLTLLGLVGMMDPPREGVREAVAGCQRAGMRVVMITGDHAVTASVIANELGIQQGLKPAVTGVAMLDMSDEELTEVVATTSVFARVSPDQKLRIVKALQERGDVVAVTGDGVNDAPALKSADIGIAMGRSGTDVAREASDMVLTDDNFASIFAAVGQGRVTFDNVRKVTFFLISTGAASILTILVALTMGWPIPFVAAQLLWLNLVTNGLQDVALAFEPGEPGVAERKPRRRDEGVISRLLWERTAIAGVVIAAGTLVMFHWAHDRSGSIVQAQTVALTTMVVYQMLHVGNARSDHRSVFRISPFSNRFLFLATGAALLVHVGALYWQPTQYVLRVEPIGIESWVRIVAVALSITVAVEAHKWLRRANRE